MQEVNSHHSEYGRAQDRHMYNPNNSAGSDYVCWGGYPMWHQWLRKKGNIQIYQQWKTRIGKKMEMEMLWKNENMKETMEETKENGNGITTSKTSPHHGI